MNLLQTLNRLFELLKVWQLPVCKAFNQGIDENIVRTLFEDIGVKPTPEMIQLYAWRNGTLIPEGTPLDDVQLIPGFHFLSLEDAIAGYLAMKDDERWNENWFPIFANGGGDFYAADLSSTDGEAPIVGFILGEVDQHIEYQSIATMLGTFLDCCEKGIVFVTEDGYLEMNDNLHAQIAATNNPNIEFWRV